MNFCYLDNVKISSFNQGKHVYVYINVYMYICDYMHMCGYICMCVNEYIYLCVTVSCFAKVDHKSFSCISFLVF